MEKKPWAQPRLVRINPFGGSTVNPYEYDGTIYSAYLTVAYTGGLGDNTLSVGAGPLGNITDFDADVYVAANYSTVAPYS